MSEAGKLAASARTKLASGTLDEIPKLIILTEEDRTILNSAVLNSVGDLNKSQAEIVAIPKLLPSPILIFHNLGSTLMVTPTRPWIQSA